MASNRACCSVRTVTAANAVNDNCAASGPNAIPVTSPVADAVTDTAPSRLVTDAAPEPRAVRAATVRARSSPSRARYDATASAASGSL